MSDRQSPSELVDFHEFRKKFPYLYICKKCAHAFDAEKPTDKCKFCGGEVKELERDDKLSAKSMLTYVCPNCYKKFIAEHAEECPKCGSKYLHSYKTVRVSTRQLLSLRKRQIEKKIKTAISNIKTKSEKKKS